MNLTSMVRIRRATTDDSAGLTKVQVDSYRRSYATFLPHDYVAQFSYEEQEKDWQEWMTAHPSDLLYLAETCDGETAAYALARAGLSDIPPYDSELLALHVRDLQQRHGIGRRLLTTIAQELKQQGSPSLMVWVANRNPARLFYERLGGVMIGERIVHLREGDVALVEVACGWSSIESLASSQPPRRS
jgi:GNAT superfamily N-acetyltransferase